MEFSHAGFCRKRHTSHIPFRCRLALPVQPVENRLELTPFGANKNRPFRSRPSSLRASLGCNDLVQGPTLDSIRAPFRRSTRANCVQRFPEEPKHLQDKDLCVHYFAKKSLSWYAPNKGHESRNCYCFNELRQIEE